MEQLKITDNRITEMPTADLPAATQDPTAVVMAAIQKGFDPDLISKMMDLAERQQANLARQAYHQALAAFKAEAPPVKKDKHNRQFNSWYTSLGHLLETYNPILGKHGLSLSFPTRAEGDNSLNVECRLSHEMGHSESISLTAPIDQAAVGKQSGQRSRNAIQDIKSTFTYLRSATCEAILGVSGTEASQDDDGNSAGVRYITEAQVKEIQKLIKTKNVDEAKFLKYMGVESIKGITVSEYGRAISALKAKAKTIPCPDQDGKDVNVAACEKCKMRQGCPSWENQK